MLPRKADVFVMTEYVILQRLFFTLYYSHLLQYASFSICLRTHNLFWQSLFGPIASTTLPIHLIHATQNPSQLSCLQFPMSYNLSSIMIHS